MRDHYDEIKSKGAELVAIGMGTPEMAAHFKQERQIPFRLLVDQQKETYRALEMRRGRATDVWGPKVWVKGAASVLRGNLQRLPKQDPMQLSGVAVVARGGEVRLVHRSKTSADIAPVSGLLKAL